MPELPPIPAQDFFFGLASAGVLLWTLMFLARSRILDRSLNNAGTEDDLFYTLLRRRESAQLSFLVSLFGHIFAVALMPWAEAALPMEFRMNFQRYDTVVVQFRTDSEPALELPSDLAEVLPPKEEKPEPADAEDGDQNDTGIGNREEAPKLETDPGGKGESTLPRYELAQSEPEEAPRAADVEADADAPELENAGLTSYELAFAPEIPDPFAVPEPGLPADGEPIESGFADGQPTDLDAGLNRGGRPGFVELAEAPGLGDLGRDGYGWIIGADGRVGEWFTGEGLRSMLASLQEIGGGAGTGSGDGFGSGADSGASGAGGSGFGTGFAGDQPVPRKLHGIILVSNDMQSLPEAAGVLTGNPVYTVYVEVPGFRKKWILQVCMPRSTGANIEFENGGVLRVLARKALDPPYAVSRATPEMFLDDENPFYMPSRLVVYFRVDERGQLLDQRIVAGVNEQTDNAVLASLEDWQFHPAFHNGEPVAVEALFGIPLR